MAVWCKTQMIWSIFWSRNWAPSPYDFRVTRTFSSTIEAGTVISAAQCNTQTRVAPVTSAYVGRAAFPEKAHAVTFVVSVGGKISQWKTHLFVGGITTYMRKKFCKENKCIYIYINITAYLTYVSVCECESLQLTKTPFIWLDSIVFARGVCVYTMCKCKHIFDA